MTHHPLLRDHTHCPLCSNPKPTGTVVCWTCHRTEKTRNGGGYSVQAEQLIAAVEAQLTHYRNAANSAFECQGCGA